MIFRLSQKLGAKIKVGALEALLLDENPFADWSAGLFRVGRTQYILLSNTKSLYSTLLPGKGITSDSTFVEQALAAIREFMEADGMGPAFQRLIAPASTSVSFAKTLNRSVTGSLTDLSKHAAYYLSAGDLSLWEIGSRLNQIPMSALEEGGHSYGIPRSVFAEMAKQARA